MIARLILGSLLVLRIADLLWIADSISQSIPSCQSPISQSIANRQSVNNLQYAQAIHGVTTLRGTGIIDTIHLVEVARAVEVLHRRRAIPDADFQPIAKWFGEYVQWLATSKNGIEERHAKTITARVG